MTLDRAIDFAIDLNSSFIDVLFLEPGLVTCHFHETVVAGAGPSQTVQSFERGSLTNTALSSEIVESDNIGSSGHFVQSIDFAMSEDLKSIGEGHDLSQTPLSFDFIDSINIVVSSEIVESDNSGVQGSTVVWVVVASSLLAFLLSSGVIVFLLTCRCVSLSEMMSLTESEIAVLTDSNCSFAAADPFLSEQNALSDRGWLE
jgi:hypothetical protein